MSTHSSDPTIPVQRQPVVTRLLWLVVAIAIVYLSLYPLEGWRLRHPSPVSFLSLGLPRYYTRADIISNLAAYLVFGLLFQLAWFRHARTPGPMGLTIAAGLLLSLVLESLQSYLPTRVPSLLDVLANTAGAAVGAAIGALLALALKWRERQLPAASAQWYSQGPALGWVLLVAWWVGQLSPQRVLFSGGSLLTPLGPTLEPGVRRLVGALGLGEPAMASGIFETLAISATLTLVGILIMDLIRTAPARIVWTGLALVIALAMRAIAAPPATRETLLAVWLTPAAQAALVLSVALLYLVAAFGRRTRLWVGLVLAPAAIGLVFLASIDPYYLASRETGPALLDPALTPSLRSLIRALGSGWPLMLAVYCLARLATLDRGRRGLSL